MKKVALIVLAALLATTAPLVLAGDDAAMHTLTGEYQWNRMEEPGPIKAVFVATDSNQWDVSFYFNFRDEDHVYSGKAIGSLSEGTLTGEVMSDGEEPRPFIFEGAFEDGVFTGTHGTQGDDAQETGTITLSRG